uniref:Glycine cleavage T-protein C-terminal barrel domain-containing protein n=1 Tax=Panagrolaimus davidi TaxID=227884 RepID=A0A914PJ76_9BILA
MDPMDKAAVGFITSGCPSPCLGKNVAVGYVDKVDAKIGKQLYVDFGKKTLGITVSKMPFVPSKYYTK